MNRGTLFSILIAVAACSCGKPEPEILVESERTVVEEPVQLILPAPEPDIPIEVRTASFATDEEFSFPGKQPIEQHGESQLVPTEEEGQAAPMAIWQDRIGDRYTEYLRSVVVGRDGLPVVAANIAHFASNPTNSTGRSRQYAFHGTLIKYDATGVRQWELRSEGSGTAHFEICGVDQLNQILVSATFKGEQSFAGRLMSGDGQRVTRLLKISPTGSLTSVYEGMEGRVVQADEQGNFYTLMTTRGQTDADKETVRQKTVIRKYDHAKYDRNARLLWAAEIADTDPYISDRRGGIFTYTTVKSAVAVDAYGNVFAVHAEQKTEGRTKAANMGQPYGPIPLRVSVLQLNSSGDGVWRRTYLTEDKSPIDPGMSIAVAGLGSIYVSGRGGNLTFNKEPFHIRGNSDFFVAKFSTKSDCQWIRRVGEADNDHARALMVDGKGNVYVGGHSQRRQHVRVTNKSGFVTDASAMSVTKLDSDGAFKWMKSYAGPGAVRLWSMAKGENGRLFLGGRLTGHEVSGHKIELQTEAGRLSPGKSDLVNFSPFSTLSGTSRLKKDLSKPMRFQTDLFVICLKE